MNIGTYIKTSWNGQLPLSMAFWVNFVALQIIAQLLVAIALIPLFLSLKVPVIGIDLVSLIILITFYVWALVGVWRSAGSSNSPVFKHAARAIVVAYSILIVVLNFR
jgi:hypothetical protein